MITSSGAPGIPARLDGETPSLRVWRITVATLADS